MAGHFIIPAASQRYQDVPQFSGFMAPCRFEGEVKNLEIIGTIPKEIDGTFYRVMPDPALPPYIDNDPWFNGDGSVSAFRIHDGAVDFKQRYVQTEKFLKERAARKALMGKYRNKYTDAIEFQIRTTSNTNIVYFNGKLLACKEDGLPYAMDPDTLETLGVWDFEGQLKSLTFTAHPKFDPITREMVCFGYEARGDGTPDVCYYTVDTSGKITEEVWLIAPVVAMIHDFAVTPNYVIFPMIPQTCSLERMKKFGEHWQWDPTIPTYFGVLPRRGAKGTDVKWFKAPNSFPGHVANAFEKDGNLIIDLPICEKNVFFWWPDAHGNAPRPEETASFLKRFTIDPLSNDMDLPPCEPILNLSTEFSRIDDRWATQDYIHTFMDVFDPALTDFPRIAPVMGGGFPPFNALGYLNMATRKYQQYSVGPTSMVQEPIFLPRSADAPEGDGYVIALVNRYETMSSDLVIIDTRNFEKEVAIVKLPIRLRAGLHGNWVDTADIDGHPGKAK